MAVILKGKFDLVGGFKFRRIGSVMVPPDSEQPSVLSWVSPTPGSLGTASEGSEVEYNFVVSDPNNNIVSFTIVNGALPHGLEMNPYSGQIYGVLANVETETEYTFRLKVEDLEGNTLFGNFSITVQPQNSEVQWQTPEGEVANASGGSEVYTQFEAQSVK